MMNYAEISKINVNTHTEKKGTLTYLSWAWAVDQLQRLDNDANWSYSEPKIYGDTMMVFCTVTAFGRARTAQLPVMDYKNKAIQNPDAMAVNTAMQRCLAKAIALHGLGLYIYAGEDVPTDEGNKPVVMDEGALADHIAAMSDCDDLPGLQKAFGVAYKAAQGLEDKGAMGVLTRAKDARKAALQVTGEAK